VSTEESCTGGLVAASLTKESGSSAYMKGGVVAYSVEMKIQLLGIPAQFFDSNNVVSEETARLMAMSVRKVMNTTFGIATTGYAGPSGGHQDNPVGTVYMAVATEAECLSKKVIYTQPNPDLKIATRSHIRLSAMTECLKMLASML
jgi:PncC family amidohydrolase